MHRRIPEEIRNIIKGLYQEGLPPGEITRKTGVSYPTVHGMTKLREKINPYTGKPFESRTEYKKFLARTKINPDTGRPFQSLSEYHRHLEEKRSGIEEYIELSKLVGRIQRETGLTQRGIAKRVGVSQQAISLYAQGKAILSKEILIRLSSFLDSDNTHSPLETLVA